MTAAQIGNEVTALQEKFNAPKAEVGKVVVGQDNMIHRLLLGLLAGGHVLIEGVPGLAKTLAISTLADTLDVKFSRIQFTPDMLPGDITGTQIFNPKEGTYSIKRGPVFGNLVLADEINRAPAKVQAALLQAMQEGQVTLGDETMDLEEPFLVMATQNPIEYEGTFPLPEAQLDRFLLQVNVDYPDSDAEREMLLATTGLNQAKAESVIDAAQLQSAQKLIRRLPVGETVVDAILKLVRSGRPGLTDDADLDRSIAWGPGPRASQALMLTCRARALLQGRVSPSIDDVIALAPSVLRHRMALNFAARADGLTIEAVIERLCQRLS